MAVKTIELAKINFKELAAAIKELNDSGKLKERINTVGTSKDKLVKAFIDGVQSIPDDKEGDWMGPEPVAAYYQKITLAEEEALPDPKKEKAVKADEAPKKDKPTKERSAKAPKAGPSTKFLVYQAWAKKNDTPLTKLEAVGPSVKSATIKSWVSSWGRGQNLPAGAAKE